MFWETKLNKELSMNKPGKLHVYKSFKMCLLFIGVQEIKGKMNLLVCLTMESL